MPKLAVKKTKAIITSCCLVALPFACITDAHAVGARGELTCHKSCTTYSIKTRADHYTEDQAAETLYRDALVFCSDKGGLTSYKVNSFFSAENIQLSGTSWEMTNYNDGRGLAYIDFCRELDIEFGKDGRFRGQSFCNNFMGEYTVSGEQISMKGGSTTFMSCNSELMDKDELVLEALRDAAKYEIKDDQLILKDDNGTVVALLRRK
ncbi:MAG: META domain-containing protein [Candidatus Electrothrix sp. EH2]|nr:META domain-containing protein [Candidatus Electrothrix sp. EH2]